MNDIIENFTDLLKEIQIPPIFAGEKILYLEIVAYLTGLVFVYVTFQLFKNRALVVIKDQTLQSRFRNWLNLLFVFVISGLSISIFSRHSNTIIAISGILSAALVVALQDFVSSFFAWVFILSREKYRVGDIIKVAGAHSYIYGRVTKIEIFRTILEERLGDGDNNGNLNREMLTGRTVSIPNNMVMKGAVMNFTLKNKALWHSYNTTITFDSDFGLAEQILGAVLEEIFNAAYYKKYHIPVSYKPKIQLSIAASGVDFCVWFPAHVDKFREILNQFCRLVLVAFKDNGIELAFNTITLNQQKTDKVLPTKN
ncbi:MAG: mechanosensitive ion channel family protein [Patescibacteria group bacterium]